MEKRISITEFRSIKSVAKACDPIITKKNSIRKKIEAMADEYKALDAQVAALEAGVVNVFGFRVEQLVQKVIEPTGAIDQKTGKPIKVTKYIPTDMVSYDEQHKQYVITTPDNETTESVVPPTTEDVAGSDYDADNDRAF